MGTRVFGLGAHCVCCRGWGARCLPGSGRSQPGRAGPTWPCGDSHPVRAEREASAAPPSPDRPRSAPRGVPGGSAPSLLPWPPGPTTCQPTVERQGTTQPHPHGQGHPAPCSPRSPSRSPARLTEPSHPSQGRRVGPEARGEPSFGSPEAAAAAARDRGRRAAARGQGGSPGHQCCPLLPCTSPTCPAGVHGWGLPAEMSPLPAQVGPTSVPPTLLLHVPPRSRGSGPAQPRGTAPATPQAAPQTLSLYT